MSDFRTKASFEKAFRVAIPNFDETKIWFKHPNKMYKESKICFVWDGKLRELPMYKSQYEIDIWKNHFIEFLNTGKFDYNGYWELYDKRNIAVEDINKVYKFPLINEMGNYFYEHSPEVGTFLENYRKRYKNCGIRQIAKPL